MSVSLFVSVSLSYCLSLLFFVICQSEFGVGMVQHVSLLYMLTGFWPTADQLFAHKTLKKNVL